MIFEKALAASDKIDGWLAANEQILLYTLAREVPPDKAIVELGSWMGKSTIMLAAGSLAGSQAPVYAVDFFTLTSTASYDYASHLSPGTQEYLSTFLAALEAAGLAAHVTPIQNSTIEAAKHWAGQPVQLLFIDADHSYETVRADFLAWVEHCSPGAQVAFHDYTMISQFPGVHRFVDRLMMTRILTDVRLVGSILYGNLTVTTATAAQRRLALCPAWMPPSSRLIQKFIPQAVLRVLKRKRAASANK